MLLAFRGRGGGGGDGDVQGGHGIQHLVVPHSRVRYSPALTPFCPPLFTAIAFDSGVASGPMSSTFVLAFTLGASSSSGGDPMMDAFGVVAMIAMVPLITIQVLGLLFRRRERRPRKRECNVSLGRWILDEPKEPWVLWKIDP